MRILDTDLPTAFRRATASVAALSLVSSLATGCAAIQPTAVASVDLERPEMRSFAVAQMTELERDVRLDTGSRKGEKLTPALFWSGITMGTIGAVASIGFGVAGFVTNNELKDGYDSGELGLAERDDLVRRGDTFNTLAITGAAVAVIGYALALITYGVDWNRCGPLAEKKRKCRALGLAPGPARAPAPADASD